MKRADAAPRPGSRRTPAPLPHDLGYGLEEPCLLRSESAGNIPKSWSKRSGDAASTTTIRQSISPRLAARESADPPRPRHRRRRQALAVAPMIPSTMRAHMKAERRGHTRAGVGLNGREAELPKAGQLKRLFDILLADPPLSFTTWNPQNGGDRAPRPIRRCRPRAVAALPVDRVAGKDCILFLWGLSPQLPAALHIMESWNFASCKSSLLWVKP